METRETAARTAGAKRDAEEPAQDVELCPVCKEVSIEPENSVFEISCAQNCTICAVCFAATQEKRGCEPTFKCPGCEDDCNCWKVKYQCATSRTRSKQAFTHREHTAEPLQPVPAPEADPDPAYDPVRFHQSLGGDDERGKDVRDTFVGLSLSVSKDGKVVADSQLFPVSVDSIEMGEDQIMLLEEIFKILHGLLISNDADRTDRHFMADGDPTDGKALARLASDDYSVLHRVVHILAYGEPLRDCPMDPEKKNWTRLGITTFAVTDIIRYTRSKYPGLIKSVIGTLLKAHSAESGIYQFLNKIGISQAYVTVQHQGPRASYGISSQPGNDYG